jgi:tripartite-type tricarboxylate transporter receptor subunit TctC
MVRILSSLLALVCCASVHAQTYPSKPIRWIVASTPGGAFDLITRALTPVMTQGFGQSVFVENRPGASGIVGVDSVAKSAADGYTVLTAGNTQLSLVRYTHANLPYDPQKDFAPVSLVGDLLSALFVHSSLPVTSVQELIDYARKNPNKLNYGSAGIGHSFHLATELFKQRTGTELVHVPFKGTGPALQELFVGRIEVMFYPPSKQLLSQVAAGKLRILGIETKIAGLEKVPTFTEAGLKDFEIPGWVGVVLPAATPREVVMRFNAELRKAIATPQIAKAMTDLSMVDISGTPEQMAKKILDDQALWGPVIKSVGIKPE